MQIESHAEKIGPGWWLKEHLSTLELQNEEEEIAFIAQFTRRLENFPCGKCRPHAVAYLVTHDIESYRNIFTKDGKRIGMFLYTVDFHNAVNERLGKPTIGHDSAYAMYIGKSCDTAKVGPGWWINDHITALGSQTDTEETTFMALFTRTLGKFPCAAWRDSAKAHLALYNIETYRKIQKDGVRVGLFLYTVEMHNEISTRIGKPTVDVDDAYAVYKTVTPCESDCGK